MRVIHSSHDRELRFGLTCESDTHPIDRGPSLDFTCESYTHPIDRGLNLSLTCESYTHPMTEDQVWHLDFTYESYTHPIDLSLSPASFCDSLLTQHYKCTWLSMLHFLASYNYVGTGEWGDKSGSYRARIQEKLLKELSQLYRWLLFSLFLFDAQSGSWKLVTFQPRKHNSHILRRRRLV